MRATLGICVVFTLVMSGGAFAGEGGVDEIIKALRSANSEARLKAVDDAGDMGAAAKELVPALIEALGHEDKDLRGHAARSLGAIGADASAAVPALTKLLSDKENSVQAYAAFALGRIGKPAASAVDQLVERAFDEDPLVRRAALRALLTIDPPREKVRPLVLKILQQGDTSIILPAMATLGREGKAVLPRLRDALKEREARYWACVALAEMGPNAAEAVPDLTAALTDDSPDVRLQAALALGEVGEAAQIAAPAVLALLKNDEFMNVRHAAAYAIAKMKARNAAEALREGLKGKDELLRIICAWGLAQTFPEDKALVQTAVQQIVEAFKSEDKHVRAAAARAAVGFDVDPELVAPALVKALEDKDPAVVANAVDGLAAFGPKALRRIDQALKNKSLRHYAVRLIARVGREAESAVPALIEALSQPPQNDEDVEFLREAQIALGRVGPGAAKAVPALIQSLKSDKDEVRASAAYALGKIGAPAARPAVPDLRKNLASDSAIVKLASVRALLEILPGQRDLAKIAAPLLIKALDSEIGPIRAEAATAIGELGELGRPVRRRLEQLLKDDDESVRAAAAGALKRLEG